MAAKKGGLGKGLDSLIPNKTTASSRPAAAKTKEAPAEKQPYQMVPIEKVYPNPEQPRKQFDEASLAELKESIATYGVLQPLLVVERDGKYEIIAGERRWRAANLVGLKKVPVFVKELNDQEVLEVSLIENIQRENLNPIEEAIAYKKLIEEFNLKQEDIAKRLSKSRAAVTNAMRLLKLEESVQKLLIDGQISAGHARALLGLTSKKLQAEAAKTIIEKNLSVREAEKLVKKLLSDKKPKKKEEDPNAFVYKDLEKQMSEVFASKVSIKSNGTKGRIEVAYSSIEELDRIYELIRSTKDM